MPTAHQPCSRQSSLIFVDLVDMNGTSRFQFEFLNPWERVTIFSKKKKEKKSLPPHLSHSMRTGSAEVAGHQP